MVADRQVRKSVESLANRMAETPPDAAAADPSRTETPEISDVALRWFTRLAVGAVTLLLGVTVLGQVQTYFGIGLRWSWLYGPMFGWILGASALFLFVIWRAVRFGAGFVGVIAAGVILFHLLALVVELLPYKREWGELILLPVLHLVRIAFLIGPWVGIVCLIAWCARPRTERLASRVLVCAVGCAAIWRAYHWREPLDRVPRTDHHLVSDLVNDDLLGWDFHVEVWREWDLGLGLCVGQRIFASGSTGGPAARLEVHGDEVELVVHFRERHVLGTWR